MAVRQQAAWAAARAGYWCSAGPRVGTWQPTGVVLCGGPALPGCYAHLPPRWCHCLVQAVQQAQPTEEEEDLQARLAAVKAG